MNVTVVSKKKLSTEELSYFATKYNFKTEEAENFLDESVAESVLIKIDSDVFLENLDEASIILTVTSSRPLDSDLLKSISEKFEVNLENISTQIDESILGGIIIKHRDHLYDGSVKSELEQLKFTLNKTN